MTRVGVDIVELERIRRAVQRHGLRFLARVYTKSELAYCRGDIARLAARWAAKEAVSKALGTGWRGIAWREVEVGHEPGGRPVVLLHGHARAVAAGLELAHWDISLSHSNQNAIAVVMACRD
jgi:holo-[acyl-carrier protein] synthase